MPRRTYNVISVFSGGMGLDIGLHRTGRFETLACVEKVPSVCDTIRANRDAGRLSSDLKVYEGDIRDMSPLAILADIGLAPGDVDVLVGGPPCQSFSTAGRRGTTQDPRGTLLWQFLRLVDGLRPKFFLMENVRGLLSAALQHRRIADRPDKGGPPLAPEEERGSVVACFSDGLRSLDGAAYHMDIFEVNSVNYGAPQLRERALFIGNRFNAAVDFPDPTHGNPHGASPRQPSLFPRDDLLPWKTLRDAIADLTESDPILVDFSPRKKRFLEMVPEGSNWRSLPLEIQQDSMGKAWLAKGGRSGWWRRLTYDLPCPTLMTLPNHASTSLCHPIETRALTVREYARIQEFPDDWAFCGSPAAQYAQIGNAVPVRLGTVAGEVLAQALDDFEAREWRPQAEGPKGYRTVYIQSHVRTRRWFAGGETKVWGEEDASYARPKTLRKVSDVE